MMLSLLYHKEIIEEDGLRLQSFLQMLQVLIEYKCEYMGLLDMVLINQVWI